MEEEKLTKEDGLFIFDALEAQKKNCRRHLELNPKSKYARDILAKLPAVQYKVARITKWEELWPNKRE